MRNDLEKETLMPCLRKVEKYNEPEPHLIRRQAKESKRIYTFV